MNGESMKKVLFVATVVKTHIMEFHIPYLKMFQEMGWETAVAARNDYTNPSECIIPYCDYYYDIPFERNPLKLGNIKAYFLLKQVINNGEYDIIHCHTPVGALLTRMAARGARKNGTKVIYTAHGFHFYKGAPLINWLIYYSAEKLCSKWTDVIITINKEDYALAQGKMKAKRIEYVPGVGIDLDKFGHSNIDVKEKKRELDIPEDSTVFLSVGELNKNKNHELVIRTLNEFQENIHYIVAGEGNKRDELIQLAKECGVEDKVHLLGYRRDVKDLYSIADIFVFPSFREGLSVSLMEAMASGLPCAVSQIRGNVDLIDEAGGALFDPADVASCKSALTNIMSRDYDFMGDYNTRKIKGFSLEQVMEIMKNIYGVA